MTITFWLGLVAGAPGATCALKPADSIVTANHQIKIGDVVELDCIVEKDRTRIADLAIAALPKGQSEVELDRSVVKALLRRRVPRLDFPAGPDDSDAIAFKSFAADHSPVVPTCQQARRAIPAGKIVVADDLEEIDCTAHAPIAAALTLDRTYRVVRAVRHISPGDVIGRLVPPHMAYEISEPVSLSIRVGQVRIERTVETAQPGVAGRDIFVKDSDGAVFAVPTLADVREDE